MGELSKPLMMMTGDELVQLAKEIANVLQSNRRTEVATNAPTSKPKEVAIGWIGLAKALGVTPQTAKARFETGALDKACKMIDGKLVTDVERAVLEWAKYKREKGV